MFRNFRTPLFLVKVFRYEYWPWWFFYIPIFPYWMYLSLKSRSLTYFTAANPSIEAGGFYGESKIDILNKINNRYKPNTVFIEKNENLDNLTFLLSSHTIFFPVIAKPNIGERGTNVEKLNTIDELKNHLLTHNQDFIVQEFVDYEIELGVLFYRIPSEKYGKVSSVTMKKFLSVVGDGKSTIEELMEKNTRARFQIENMRKKLGKKITSVIPDGENLLLEPIGNHCRGTMFYSGNHLINDRLHEVFNDVALPVDGFYYGRFDMKVKSFEDLYKGENIKILELNGVSAEPAHIYDPAYTLLKAYRDFTWHMTIIYKICAENIKNGIKPVSKAALWEIIKLHFFTKESKAETKKILEAEM